MPAKIKHKKGFRYTADQKRMILSYVENHGRRGITEAVQEFGVSAPSIYLWISNGGSGDKSKRKVRGRSSSTLNVRKSMQLQKVRMALKSFGKQMSKLQEILKSLLLP